MSVANLERTATRTSTERFDRPLVPSDGSHQVPTEGSLRAKDFFGLAVAAIITLGPLAATALFAH